MFRMSGLSSSLRSFLSVPKRTAAQAKETKVPEFSVIPLNTIGGHYEDVHGNVIDVRTKAHISSKAMVFLGRDARDPSFRIKASNNHLIISEDVDLFGSLVVQFMGAGSRVTIGERNWFESLMVIASDGSFFETGNDCSFQSVTATVYEGGRIAIGNDCMFSHNVELWQTDTHPIFDLATGDRINLPRDICVRDHVWLGADVTLLGGADIGAGSVVGAHAVTSNVFPEHVILAGNPAKVIRTGITWEPEELCLFNIKNISDCKRFRQT
jgi:acetyltransferase-like isoleucine patch superfamily enzyme